MGLTWVFGVRMNRESFWLILRAVAVAIAVVLFAIAAATGNVVGMIVWGLFVVVWSVQVWFALQKLRAEQR